MSAITPNPFATGLPPAATNFGFGTGDSSLAAALTPNYAQRNDAISLDAPWRLPSRGSSFESQPDANGGYTNPQTNGDQSQFMAIVSQLLGAVSSLFAQLGSMFGAPSHEGSPNASSPEQNFANATAGSVGDPHESFHGTTGSGSSVDGTWDSMTSHDNLLSSNSFHGGYRVSTAVTQPNANGVTLNDRVSVATDGGNTNVSMNKDGSYDVSSYGQKIELQTGTAVPVSDHETATKNGDGSLTIDDRNERGGSIQTTLERNANGGVDVKSIAKEVDLGGYLVDKRDGDRDPVAAASFRDHGVAPSENAPWNALV